MNVLTDARSKIVYEIGEIPGSGQTIFHLEMISNVLSLNKITKKYWVTFYSGDENVLGCILEIRLLSFQPIMTEFISLNPISF